MAGMSLVFAQLCAACGSLPEAYLVEDLRIVAMIAEPPEAYPGETVTLTTYFFDPDSSERPVSGLSYRCTDPEDVGCMVRGETPLEQAEAPVERTAGEPDLFVMQSAFVVPADVFSAGNPLTALYGAELNALVRGTNGTRTIDGVKRIKVPSGRPPQPRNQNPVIYGFDIAQDGVELGPARDIVALNRDQRYSFTPRYDASRLVPYFIIPYDDLMNPTHLMEEASFSWTCSPTCSMSQRVSFAEDIVEVTTPFQGAPTNRFTIHVVMRDGRGGEALFVKTFELLPAVHSP